MEINEIILITVGIVIIFFEAIIIIKNKIRKVRRKAMRTFIEFNINNGFTYDEIKGWLKAEYYKSETTLIRKNIIEDFLCQVSILELKDDKGQIKEAPIKSQEVVKGTTNKQSYYQKKRQERLEYNRQYYMANRSRIRKQQNERNRRNREKLKK
jgi:hypothetical protein